MKLKHLTSALCLAAGLSISTTPSQAALVGAQVNDPVITASGSGIIDYVASTGATGKIKISLDPSTIFGTSPFISSDILGTGVDDERMITIEFNVNKSNGQFDSGVTTSDLIVKGWIDYNGSTIEDTGDFSGTLLTAEVTQFGFLNGAGSAADTFDLKLTVTGGSLAPFYPSGSNLGIRVTSEPSAEYTNPFNGSFTSNFIAQAKGSIGSDTPNGPCHVKLQAYCSVGSGPLQEKCRIKKTRSPKHWERCEYSHHGKTYRHSKYGMFGAPVPPWSANYQSTNVTFTYILTNDGTVDANNILLEDSFDTPLTGVPATLAPGATATVTRTIALHEPMENEITLCAENGSNDCGAHDTVAIKDKERNRRRFDDDDYKDKDN